MTLEDFREYCMRKAGFTEDLPFGPRTLVFRVDGRMFAAMDADHFVGVNLKCDPVRAVELREHHAGITPGYHMNKKHWNTVATDGSVPDRLLLELADHSYELVRAASIKGRRHRP